MSKQLPFTGHYSVSFKLQVVEEALLGDISKAALCRKYSLSGSSVLYRWIRIFAPKVQLLDTPMKSPQPIESDEIRALKRQLQLKEIELKREKMRADFLDEMINVSEEMFNIPIRKKVGTKQ